MSDPDIQAALREMSRTIGGLESTVKTMLSTWQAQEAAASEGRRELHRKFEALSDKVSTLAGKVEAILADLGEIKPTVDAVETAKQQALGAGKLGRAIWLAAMVVSGGAGWVLSNWLKVSIVPIGPIR